MLYKQVLADEKLNMTQQCALPAQKPNGVLGCTKRSENSRSKEVNLPLCSTLGTPHLGHCIQLRRPQYEKDMDLLEQIQRKAMKTLRGLEPLGYGDRLRELGCSDWRREGSRENLEHLPVPKGATRAADFGQGPGVTTQEHQQRAKLDEILGRNSLL
ncbi:hypothetical protein WISP_87932 [Willisornis vidua]|uniref:Uncharacterized protein n=1 Tax=Willisornis vidua TaxID=1566151 RepID=A0ABQ9D2I2_9PASS|nr:hypothetical protein WISP_87932 [Willisornis vidua]